MPRVLGTLAAFAGWMSILVSAAAGLLVSEVLGLAHTEGPLPPSSVYGLPEIVVMWILIGAAVLALLPVGAAILSRSPSRTLYVTACSAAIAGIALLPDDLGRVHALALIPGAAAFAGAGYVLRESSDAATEPPGGADAPAAAAAPALAAAAAAIPAAPAPQPAAPVPPPPRAQRGAAHVCPWCSTEHKARAATCRTCGAALTASPGIADEAIPGVTVVAPQLRDYASKAAASAKKKERPSLLATLLGGGKDDRIMEPSAAVVNEAAFHPPSDEVRREMARLEAEIAATAAAREMALHEWPPAELDRPGDPPAGASDQTS